MYCKRPLICFTLDKNMNYDETRKRLETRACLFLAKPVAILLSVVYEPRVDGVNYPASFSNLVGETKDALREGLRTLGSQNGGKIEGFALERAKTLIEAADQAQLHDSISLIKNAIERTETIPNKKPRETINTDGIDRIAGPSGKPIGLWR